MSDTLAITPIPRYLDDALYNTLRGLLGSELAFAAVDAVWSTLLQDSAIVDGWLGIELEGDQDA